MHVFHETEYKEINDISQHSRNFKEIPSTVSESQILQSCCDLLLYEGCEIYPIVIKKIIKILNNSSNFENSLNNHLVN